KSPFVLNTIPRLRIDLNHFAFNKEELPMEPKLIRIKELKVLGIVRYGDGKDGEFNRVWGKWHDQNNDVQWKNDQVGYGLNFYPPDFKSMDEHYQYYMPCMEVENFDNIPMHMVAKKIPACTCAVFAHKGMAMNIGELYHQIFFKWLPNSGYELSEPFCIEVYDVRNNRWKGPDDPESETDLYIPVKESALS
ncbi:MAG TPA: GyrI-like domain-containing protein, partial [Bacillota bacterium]|nr:GyrI-like domain-containing protein [Bacillota bacterium]